jgi:1,4-dihydroxy-6-naphthoate synthase
MTQTIRVGLSTCPNDTFAFHALLTGAVDAGLPLAFVLADVEELNQRMLDGELDLAKTSVHAMLAMAERVRVLSCGAALGFGVGPLLLAAPGCATRPPLSSSARVLTPGRWTTAALLLELFAPELFERAPRWEPVVFSSLLPRLAAGTADYGACIHEARFTWREHGLGLVADLGTLFERRTGTALPLGGLCVSRRLERGTALTLQAAIRRSIEWGLAHRAECLPTMRRYAQEQSDAVLWAHVDLYVNEWTVELGAAGREALGALGRLARDNGRLPGAELSLLCESSPSLL